MYSTVLGLCILHIVCIEHSEGTKRWSHVKISKSRVKPASTASSVSDLNVKDWLYIDYQRCDDVPGMEIETTDDIFWVPITHRTWSRLKMGLRFVILV